MKTTLLVLTCVLLGTSVDGLSKKKIKVADPKLAGIHKIFVKGNNEASITIQKGAPVVSCFDLADNLEKADDVLEVSQTQSQRSDNENRVVPISTVSATLTRKDGS